MTQKKQSQSPEHKIDVRHKGRPEAIAVKINQDRAKGLLAGLVLGSALTLGVTDIARDVQQIAHRESLVREYGEPGVLEALIDTGAIDPRNASVIQQAIESPRSDDVFEPFRVVLTGEGKDNEVVVVGKVSYGDTPTSIALDLAPSQDPTNIAQIITNQLGGGDSSQIQQQDLFVLPGKLVDGE
jgi:hypothetical protein